MTTDWTVRRIEWLGRWLWIPVVLLLAGVALYALLQLIRLEDANHLSAEVAELRSYQELIAGTALGLVEDEGPPSEIAAEASAQVEGLEGELARAFGEARASEIVSEISGGMETLAHSATAIKEGGLPIALIVAPYLSLSGDLEATLSDLSVQSEEATEGLRLAFIAGLAALVIGAFSAFGFGWASRRAHRLRGEYERAREVDRVRSEFVAIASHELRTPLTGIYGFSRLLADDEAVPEEQRRWATHVHTEAARLAAIVDDLLVVARIDGGDVQVASDRIEIRRVIEQVVSGARAGSEGPELVVQDGANATVLGDHNRLVEVLGNLVDNAIKYSPDGGAVHIASRRQAGFLRVEVRDHGVGIPADQLPKLFERFHRVPNARTEHVRSTGLGLYVVRQLVEAMGGEVGVSSVLGKGSTFSFTVPLAPALDVPLPEAA